MVSCALSGKRAGIKPDISHAEPSNLPSNTFASTSIRGTSEKRIFTSSAPELDPVTVPFHARTALELLINTLLAPRNPSGQQGADHAFRSPNRFNGFIPWLLTMESATSR